MTTTDALGHLIGTTVRHGNLVGPVQSVTPTAILVAARPGHVVAIPIPAHLLAALGEVDT